MNCNSNIMDLNNSGSVSLDTCSQKCATQPINLICNRLIVPTSELVLANQYNNHSNKKIFYLPLQDINGISWEDKKFYIVIQQNDMYDEIEINGDNLKITDTNIQLIWDIDSTVTAESGDIKVQLRVSGNNYEYYSNITTFNVLNSINSEGSIEEKYPTILKQIQEEQVVQNENIAKNAGNIKENSAAILELSNKIADIGDISEIRNDIENLQTDNENNKTDITKLKEITSKNAEEIEKIKQEQTTQNKNIEENASKIDTNKIETDEKIMEIENEQLTQNENIEKNNNDIKELSGAIEEVNNEISNIKQKIGHVYGIRRKMTNNSSPIWERLFDSIGKVSNATKDGTSVVNDFDNISPWSEIKSCNYDLTTKKINAWFGDANFKFDGSNGDVFTYIPKTYWKIYQENDYDYVLLSDVPKVDFFEIESFFIGRYNGSVVSNILHTYSGLVPTTSKNIAQFREFTKSLGNNFSQLDWRYFIIQMLYLVEYANYNSQLMLGNGVMSRRNLKTIIGENDTNRAIVSSSSGYYVGQIIRIGTTDGGIQITDARKIVSIAPYSEGGVIGYALTFDGAAVNIAVDNFVCTMAQMNGQCDTLGMKSGCLNNDEFHSMIYRGIENIYANAWQFVDGINIISGKFYVCKDHSLYVSDTTDNYKQLNYNVLGVNGWAKDLNLDNEEPLFRFTKTIGGNSSSYLCDYYYNNEASIVEGAKRVALVGGRFDGGASAGLWYWDFGDGSSAAGWGIGCRVLIDNQ